MTPYDNDPTRPALIRAHLLRLAAQRHLDLAEERGLTLRQAHAWLHARGFFEAGFWLRSIRRTVLIAGLSARPQLRGQR